MKVLIEQFFGYISNNDLFGVIPLDIICHVLVGFILTKSFLKLKLNFTTAFIIVTLIALGKEFNDSFVLYNGNKMQEHIKDIFFTIIPALFIYLSLKAKSSARKQNFTALN